MTYYVRNQIVDIQPVIEWDTQLKRRAPDREELGASNTVHNIVNKIIRITIETGSFTGMCWVSFYVTYCTDNDDDAAAVNIVTLALNIISSKHTTYFQCTLATLTGIYATTFMVVLNSRIKFSVSSMSTTWKDTESGRLPPAMGNIMHGDNSSSVIDNRREGKVNTILVGGPASRSGDMEFPAMKEVRFIYSTEIGANWQVLSNSGMKTISVTQLRKRIKREIICSYNVYSPSDRFYYVTTYRSALSSLTFLSVVQASL